VSLRRTRCSGAAESDERAAVQGVGGGGVAALCYILISDLVPLKDRGSLNGIVAM
jgi:MFS family permease